MIHISGLTSGDKAPNNIAEQTEIIFEKMRALLEAEGGGLEHLVKINAYIVDIREYPAYNAVRNRLFATLEKPPASATIGGAQLIRPGLVIEIDGVAIIGPQS
jgi:enamine deaminase RidA (YjgF/YER057c/UK114 family)